MPAFYAILPVALVIATGFAARRFEVVPASLWHGVETLAFRVLMPAVLVTSIAVADLRPSAVGRFGAALLLTLALAAGVLLALRRLTGRSQLSNPRFTTLFQTVTRWNAFIALALAGQIGGTKGVAEISVAMAFMIPTINVVNISVLAQYGTAHPSLRHVARTIALNPLVLASALGVALNLSGLGLSQVVSEALSMLGRGAVGVSLLAVGAGIELRRLWSRSGALWLGVGARMLALPALFLLLARLFGLGPAQTLAGVMVFAVPTAANGYVVAKAMGGDADLYADILTWQTLFSVLSLPLLLLAAQTV